MKIVMTGGTGWIGSATLHSLCSSGHSIRALVRNQPAASSLGCETWHWEAGQTPLTELAALLHGMDGIIHLAGEPIAAGRWSTKKKQKIRDTRVLGTKEMVNALRLLPVHDRPKVLISASAIGLYGDRSEEELSESASPGSDFLAQVVQQWEQEALAAEGLGVRVVLLRLGIVLGRGGGILRKMQPIILGSGQQWMSWIHLDDVVRFMEFALLRDGARGAFHLTSPHPVRNREFTEHIARATGALGIIRVPAFLLQLGLGEMAQIVLSSCKALPSRAAESGFDFTYPKLDQALGEIYPAKVKIASHA